MKKLMCLVLAMLLLMSSGMASASVTYYQQHQSNEATFETLEEAHANAPVALSNEYPERVYVGDPALDDYPQGTTYVYRSAGIYNAISAANRMNTNIPGSYTHLDVYKRQAQRRLCRRKHPTYLLCHPSGSHHQ